MPLPLLFIGIAAATGALGAGKTTKAAVERFGKTNSDHCPSTPCIVLNQ